MANQYGANSIVSDKLVLCIDAIDKHSNPGSGTTVNDIGSGASHTDFANITLDSNPYFFLNGGYIRWTDIGPKLAGAQEGTMSCWWYQVGGTGNDAILNAGDFSTNWNVDKMNLMWNNSTDKLSVYVNSTDTTAVITGDFGNALSVNTLYNIVWSSTGHLYVNGSLHADLSNTWWFGDVNGFDYFMFGAVALNGSIYGDQRAVGRLYNLMIHNKALSASEVEHNYNVQRKRFGV